MKVVPFPSSLSAWIVPLCLSMIDLETVSPRPTPFALVVNRGSKIFARTSSEIPLPVSENNIST